MTDDTVAAPPAPVIPAAPAAPPPMMPPPAPATSWLAAHSAWLVGAYLVACWAACMAVFVTLWPGFGAAELKGENHLLSQTRFLALVAAAGALGACLQAVTSFSGYLGNRKFSTDWALWYLSRPPIGATMAVIFLPLVGAGIIPDPTTASGQSTAPDDLESYAFGLISVGILVGMFSKNAADKLADVFDALMSSNRDQTRGGKLVVDTPQVLALTPSTVTAGTTTLRLQATGTGFSESSVILVNGQPRQTAYQDARTVYFTLDPSDVATAGTLTITARTPAPDRTLEGSGVTMAVVA
ncbi:hypothetical protein ACM64Y_13930 [Novispirillum sp. DQ9]|uniref:hypothetical protein n=1 Tax=Novispirillum sp. DQ9 TaxID=3398612 RepID=UPI003C7A0B7D